MKSNTKSKLTGKILLMGILLAISLSAAGQADYKSTKGWGVSLNYYYEQEENSLSLNLLYRYKKSCFFAAYGLRKNPDDYYYDYYAEPEYYLGYRRYPSKKQNNFKFYYQTFLFYSTHHVSKPYNSNSYITLFFGPGIEYNFAKRFSAGINSNVGIGHDFNGKSPTGDLIPLIFTFCYRFNERKL
jgi:hypothetical protein